MRFVGPFLFLVVSLGAVAQDKPVPIDLPSDGIEVRTLADIVSKRLKIPILYDDTINNKKVMVRIPADMPESALMGVLNSALRMKQLALVDADQPGWKQIVAATNLAAVARPGAAGDAATPIIQVVNLKQSDPGRIAEAIRPYLSQPGGSVLPVQGRQSLIISDYAGAMARIEQVIKTLDEGPGIEVRFIELKQSDPTAIAASVQSILTARDGATAGVTIAGDERTGQLVVIAPRGRIDDIAQIVAGLDKPLELATRVYRLKTIGPERLDRLVKALVGASQAKRAYQSSPDRESQSLVVSATEEIHKRIDALLKELDQPVAEAQSPVRFYKLKNTKAADVLATLSSLMGESASVVRPEEQQGGDRSLIAPPKSPGENRLPVKADQNIPGVEVAPRSAMAAKSRGEALGPMADLARRAPARAEDSVETADGEGMRSRDITVTADVNTNSIIVIAPPAVQQLYSDLIARLDQRRPQVQIECTVVTLDTSDNFTFGVDIGKGGGFGENNQVISFGSFGVATVDPKSGRLTPLARSGGTFALLSPGIADVVLRAVSGHSRARLVSAPQLLVNDNGKGKLQSVNQEPFAEILDTSSTQSRTGLGGLAQAGTTISVEPHISEDDYLQLTYSIELSSFTGAARQGLPPPSQKNSIDSTVTIPDGHTIVVGGLQVKNLRGAVDSIPIIEQIPLVNLLFGTRTNETRDLTLFVFIHPVILRSDKFEDLKHLSGRASDKAELPSRHPRGEPIPLR